MPDAESRVRVLVAEDDPSVRDLICEVLRIAGHAPHSVPNAQEAFRLLLRQRFSLLITDVTMPGTSGLVLAREVRSRGLLLPILILSGSHEPGLLENVVLDLGSADFLLKPFDLAEMRDAIGQLLASVTPDHPNPASKSAT